MTTLRPRSEKLVTVSLSDLDLDIRLQASVLVRTQEWTVLRNDPLLLGRNTTPAERARACLEAVWVERAATHPSQREHVISQGARDKVLDRHPKNRRTP